MANPLGLSHNEYGRDGIEIATRVYHTVVRFGYSPVYDSSSKKIVIMESANMDPAPLNMNLFIIASNAHEGWYPRLDSERVPITNYLRISLLQKPSHSSYKSINKTSNIFEKFKILRNYLPSDIFKTAYSTGPIIDLEALLDHGSYEEVESAVGKSIVISEENCWTLWHKFPQLALTFLSTHKNLTKYCPFSVIDDLCKAKDKRVVHFVNTPIREEKFVELCQKYMPFMLDLVTEHQEIAKECPTVVLDLLFDLPDSEPFIVACIKAGCQTRARHHRAAVDKKFDQVAELLKGAV